jgi:hypothetical protein
VFIKSFKVSERPVVGKKTHAVIVESNSGSTAYNALTEIRCAIVPTSLVGELPRTELGIQKYGAPVELGEDNTLHYDCGEVPTDAGLKALEDGRAAIVFYGHIKWEDSLGQKYNLPFCRAYAKELFPDLVLCPEKINIPKN